MLLTTQVNAVMKSCVLESPLSYNIQTIWPRILTSRNWINRSVRDRRALAATYEDGPRLFDDFITQLLFLREPFSDRGTWFENRGTKTCLFRRSALRLQDVRPYSSKPSPGFTRWKRWPATIDSTDFLQHGRRNHVRHASSLIFKWWWPYKF